MRFTRGRGVTVVLAAMLGLTLLGEPAPTALGLVELLLVAGVIAIAGAGLVGARLLHAGHIGASHASILAVLAVYCLSQLLTLALGILQGASPAAAIRAVAPYLLFLPVAAAIPFLSRAETVRPAVRALVVAGVAHAIFLLALFATGVQDILDLRAVFFGRTTLLDARTTIPLFLASVLLPLAWLTAEHPPFRRVTALGLIVLSTVGALTTQTRSQLLAVAAGGLVFLAFYAIRWAVTHGRSVGGAMRRVVAIAVLALAVGTAAIATVPSLRVLAQSVALRTEADQDNGRLANEWIPAVRQVSVSATTLALGIGAGATFITGEGEERTYVHNLAIYSLVYGGITGVIATALLYLVIAAGLLHRARTDAGLESAALLALLVALGVYAQFFAVHKLLSYNLMLALLAGAAVSPGAPFRVGTGHQ